MTDFVLVRHGATVWPDKRYAGSTDVALSAAGRRQASELASWVARAGLADAWASPLARTRETAELAITGTGLALHLDRRLEELDFGDAEGLTVEEMRVRFPSARDAFEHDPLAHPLPGGEPPRAAVQRALDCLREIASSDGEARVLVVTHGTLIRLLVCDLLGLALSDYRRRLPMIDHTAVTELRVLAGEAALLRFNAPVSGPTEP
jgi:broad specificity phosphatase PhoE